MANIVLKKMNYSPNHNSDTLTVGGVFNKTVFLLLILVFSGVASIYFVAPIDFTLLMRVGSLACILAFVVGLAICFKQAMAPILSVPYAILEGVALGSLSWYYNNQFEGIVVQAVLLTILDLFIMLVLYRLRIIKVTEEFKSFVIGATCCIAIAYIVEFFFILFFNIHFSFLHDSSPLSLGISIFVICIASLNLLLDFDLVEKSIECGAPKSYEWYVSFGLLVTIIWIYLEILKLLAKLKRK